MRRLLVIPLFLALLMAGALVWSGGATQKRADFAFINRGDIITLDLNQMSYLQDFRLTYGIREGLYSPDPVTLLPIPAVATGYDLSEDKKTWTFHLRKEAKWSNGDPVTAQDFVFSFRRMLEDPGDYTYLVHYFHNASEYEKAYAARKPFDMSTLGFKAMDAHTLRLQLDNPVSYMLELVAFPPFYPRHEKSMEPFKRVMENGRVIYDATYTRPPFVVTNGPYVLSRWDFHVRLVLTRSPFYWDRENVKIETLEMVVSDNALSQFLMYERGDVDWLADVDAEQAAELKARGRTDLKSSPAFGTGFLTLMCRPTLPTGGPNPLADVRVRQALALSIDKEFITKYITRMGELPARTYLPPDGTLPDFRWLPGPYDPAGASRAPFASTELRTLLPSTKDPSGPGLPYNTALARKLLAEAGYPGGNGFPVLPVLYNSNSAVRGKIAQALKDQWKTALGITVEVASVEGSVFKEHVSKKDYVIATTAWYGDYPDISTFTDKYLSDSLNNDSDWQNKTFDGLCKDATREADPVARVAMLSKAEHLIDTEMPIIPLYHYVNVGMIKPYVTGVAPNPRGLTIFKSVTVTRDAKAAKTN